jgi:hypothetical protein
MKQATPSNYLQARVKITDGLPVRVGNATHVVERGSEVKHTPDHKKAYVLTPDKRLRVLHPGGELPVSKKDQARLTQKHFPKG